jgi:hypothetical protein
VFPDPYKRNYELRQRYHKIIAETEAIAKSNAWRAARNALIALVAFVAIRFVLYYVNQTGSAIRGIKFDTTGAYRVMFEPAPTGSLRQIVDAEYREALSQTSRGRALLKKKPTAEGATWLNMVLQGFRLDSRGDKVIMRIQKRREMLCRMTTQSKGRSYSTGWIEHRPRELPFWKLLWNVGVHGDPGTGQPDYTLPCDGNLVWEFRGRDGSYVRTRWVK